MIGRTNMGAGKEEQEKTVSITTNGTVEIVPDTNKTLSKVTANVDVSPQLDQVVLTSKPFFQQTTVNTGYNAWYQTSVTLNGLEVGKYYAITVALNVTGNSDFQSPQLTASNAKYTPMICAWNSGHTAYGNIFSFIICPTATSSTVTFRAYHGSGGVTNINVSFSN